MALIGAGPTTRPREMRLLPILPSSLPTAQLPGHVRPACERRTCSRGSTDALRFGSDSAFALVTAAPWRTCILFTQDLLHGPTLGQFIHQLVQVPDLSHQRVIDLLDSNPANHASDLAGVGMERRGLAEK